VVVAMAEFTTRQKWMIDETDIEFGAAIGKGRSGIVYRVQCRGTVMACKIIGVGENQKHKQKLFLQKEAKILSRLHHPNIIQLFGVCISDSTLALLMEYADQGTLRDELDREMRAPSGFQKILGQTQLGDSTGHVVHGELAAWRKFEVLHQVVLAMDTVHRMCVIHQDLKPPNCMIVKVVQMAIMMVLMFMLVVLEKKDVCGCGCDGDDDDDDDNGADGDVLSREARSSLVISVSLLAPAA
jgi:serine/threonine protein kinase